MEDSLWETFCYHFALDYDNFRNFFHKWFTIRGIVKQINLDIPHTPRIYISVPLVKETGILIHSLSVESGLTPSSIDEIDVLYEGSLCSDRLSSCCDDPPNLNVNDEGNRITPDIVRTIAKNYHGSKLYKSDSFRSLPESETDPGFQSDTSVGVNTFKKLEELQGQFSKMQKDIANLINLHNFHDSNRTLETMSSFTPIMSSSPAIKTRLEFIAPPPPCLPPPPPTPSNPVSWKSGLATTRKEINPLRDSRTAGMPDMTEILKEISSVKLRPIKQIDMDQAHENNGLSFVPRVPLRPVSRHESVIASALRERFQHFRMIVNSNESSAAEISDDWDDDDDSSTIGLLSNSINAGRALLRKVDRSKLPDTVSRDFMDEPLAPYPCSSD